MEKQSNAIFSSVESLVIAPFWAAAQKEHEFQLGVESNMTMQNAFSLFCRSDSSPLFYFCIDIAYSYLFLLFSWTWLFFALNLRIECKIVLNEINSSLIVTNV